MERSRKEKVVFFQFQTLKVQLKSLSKIFEKHHFLSFTKPFIRSKEIEFQSKFLRFIIFLIKKMPRIIVIAVRVLKYTNYLKFTVRKGISRFG